MILYLWSIDKYLGKYGLYSSNEIIEADSLEKEWRFSQPRYSFYQLLDIFPEAKPYLKRKLKKEIELYKEDLHQAERVRVNFNNQVLSKVSNKDKWFWTMVRDILFVEPLKKDKEKKIKRNAFYLSSLAKPEKKEIKDNKITDYDIQRAKEIPLESLYVGRLIQRGPILWGLCPFIQERTPSFAIYTEDNHFFCYSCTEAGDSIAFIMKQENCDFITAVKRLTNK